MRSHWFIPMPEACVACGEPLEHEDHKRRCTFTWSEQALGFIFCQLERDHDGPHQGRDYLGVEREWDGATT